MQWPPERDPREPLGPLERMDERLLALEKESKRHADEIRAAGEWRRDVDDMGIADLSKHERQAFPDALRFVLAQISSDLRRDASVRIWLAIAGTIGAMTGAFAQLLVQLFHGH